MNFARGIWELTFKDDFFVILYQHFSHEKSVFRPIDSAADRLPLRGQRLHKRQRNDFPNL